MIEEHAIHMDRGYLNPSSGSKDLVFMAIAWIIQVPLRGRDLIMPLRADSESIATDFVDTSKLDSNIPVCGSESP